MSFDLGLDATARARDLHRMRTIATGLLLLAAVVYVLTHGRGGVWGFVNAGAEASMVGAMADWFAVTALFRHPLGLPVPHTAIIPRRKDELGAGLETFVRDNFLTPENARRTYLEADVVRRVAAWARDPQHARRVVDDVSPLAARALTHLKDDEIVAWLQEHLLPRLSREPVAPLAGSLLAEVVRDGAHRGVVDIVLREVHDWLVDNEAKVELLMRTRAPWWSPQWVDKQVTGRVHAELVRWAADVRDTPDHRVRTSLDDLLAALAHDLQHDAAVQARAEEIKERVLAHERVPATLVAVWDAAKRALLEALGDADGPLRARLQVLLVDAASTVLADDALRQRLDEAGAAAVEVVVSQYGAEVVRVISTTIERWDAREASENIELFVGRDLQFIRINGTLVGGLVGLVIHAVALVL